MDFSAGMLIRAREKLPNGVLIQGNLLDEWPAQIRQPFDRVVSAYVFHTFDLNAKIDLLKEIASFHLALHGCIVIADVAFPSVEARESAARQWKDRWDDSEFYWAADETISACSRAGLEATYEQVSSCGGIFMFKPM